MLNPQPNQPVFLSGASDMPELMKDVSIQDLKDTGSYVGVNLANDFPRSVRILREVSETALEEAIELCEKNNISTACAGAIMASFLVVASQNLQNIAQQMAMGSEQLGVFPMMEVQTGSDEDKTEGV